MDARYFAEIDNNNIVKRVIVADNKEWCEQNLGGVWVETFMDKRNNKNYAGIGYMHHSDKDNFSSPQPFKSWKLDKNCIWQAPKKRLKMNTFWDEEKQDWIEEKDK